MECNPGYYWALEIIPRSTIKLSPFCQLQIYYYLTKFEECLSTQNFKEYIGTNLVIPGILYYSYLVILFHGIVLNGNNIAVVCITCSIMRLHMILQDAGQ